MIFIKTFYTILKTVVLLTIAVGAVFCIINFANNSNTLDELQLSTFKILAIICTCAVAYCFIVGEITRNNSQMDKLWSLLPEIYLWVVAVRGNMAPRLIIMAVIATLWGARLTYNFAKKGAYSIKFWAGEEDYRWSVLRKIAPLSNKFVWALFDLFFISIYQNVLILLTTIPALLAMNSTKPLNFVDIIAAVLMLAFLSYETIADVQQMNFHTKKKELLKEGKKLEELPSPYNLGFNTTGLWNRSRHPNYIGEQMIWISLYIFSIAAGYDIFNWSLFGGLLLILLFAGSSMMAEIISSSKYPMYKDYQSKVFKYVPIKKYR